MTNRIVNKGLQLLLLPHRNAGPLIFNHSSSSASGSVWAMEGGGSILSAASEADDEVRC